MSCGGYAMKKEYRKKLLKYRVVLLFIVIGLVLDVVMIGISYAVYTKNMNASYENICSGVTQVMASNIDGNKVSSWLKGNDTDGYYSIKQTLSRIRNSVADIENIYVYRMTEEGIQVVFDVNTTGLEAMKAGTMFEYGPRWSSFKNDLIKGKEIAPMVTDDKSGWLMTAVKPIFDSKGNCVAYAGCDISMAKIAADREAFMRKLALPLGIASVLVILIAIIYLEKKVVYPINRLDTYTRSFVYDNSTAPAVQSKMASLQIDTGKEVNDLRDNLTQLMDTVSQYTYEAGQLKENVIDGIVTMIDDRSINEQGNANVQYVKVILDELRKKAEYQTIITDEFYDNVLKAAPLYDIGELAVSEELLSKPGKLTEEEYEHVKTHTVSGSEMIAEAIKGSQSAEYVNLTEQMAKYHHEHWDGTGYPEGLKGTDIPLAARIIAVPDVFNALISKRSYKKPKSIAEAFGIIAMERGTHFDPDIVDAFLAGRNEIEKIIRNIRLK